MKLNAYNHFIMIQIMFKFHEDLIIGYLEWLFFWTLNQFKGFKSYNPKASLMKLDVHQRVIAIYIHFKFHKIPSSGYLDMTPDEGRKDRRMDGHREKRYPSRRTNWFKFCEIIGYLVKTKLLI